MAVTERERQHEEHSNGSGGGSKNALTTAAVAAATGAAAYGLQKALTKGSGHGGSGSRRGRDEADEDSNPVSIVGSAAASAWESASHTLIPFAEDAAEAAGKWVAEHAPEVVRERILPRFIESYNQAA